MAYGQSTSARGALVLDFTEAVKYWTGSYVQTKGNNGFFLCNIGDTKWYTDYFTACTKSASTVRDRPALYVIYDTTNLVTPVPVSISSQQVITPFYGSPLEVTVYPVSSRVIIQALDNNLLNTIRIFDISGKQVYSSAPREANNTGVPSLTWNCRTNAGQNVGNGSYVIAVNSKKGSIAKRLNIVR